MNAVDSQIWDAVIVGGGAAGFFGAITCARLSAQPIQVLILEKARRVLGKVAISGGGRCNVTHHCFEPKRMALEHYPRGNKALIGPFHHFGVAETIRWFESRGMELKTEDDGRIFPTTDDSQTVIDCLQDAAQEFGVETRTGQGVKRLQKVGNGFELQLTTGGKINARSVLVATGGTRLSSSASLAEQTGHKLKPAVPSLFTFHVDDPRITGLQGLSVDPVEVSVVGESLESTGPLLITHRGFSGPAILKSSAWGARLLAARDYKFSLVVNWLPNRAVEERLMQLRGEAGKRQVRTLSPFEAIPKRLWRRLVRAAQIPDDCQWASLTVEARRALVEQLCRGQYEVRGKSTHKEEFVTCGGVPTDDVDMRTMESRICADLYFAGEILDIDGVTGGFNFQSAWTTGYLAGQAMADALGS